LKSLTVSQASTYLKQLISQDELLRDIWITGEISNLRISTAGHAYFTLKDPHSQIRCVMFARGTGLNILENGRSITSHGRMSFYETSGSLDFLINIVISEGSGPLAMQFEKLKSDLESEGLFEPSRKRPLPRFPRTIGLITSPSGSVIHDVRTVLNRRYPIVKVILVPAMVQGRDSAPDLIRSIKMLNNETKADVIIIARGGGSLEDLSAFNEESLARAIYVSRIPIISGIGHETDFTIADFVADMRAPTPSAAAEIATPDRAALTAEIMSRIEHMNHMLINQVSDLRYKIERTQSRLHYRIPDIASYLIRVDEIASRLVTATDNIIINLNQKVTSLHKQINTLDPISTLQRGYAVIQRHGSPKVLSETKQFAQGDEIDIALIDGTIEAIVGNSRSESN